MSDATVIAYLAGCIDSDGWIGVSRRGPTYSARMALKQVTPQVPDLLRATWGGSRYVAKPSVAAGRPLHTWTATHRIAERALTDLLPHLRIKHAQAENAIAAARVGVRRRFPVPEVVPGEPLLTLTEVAARLGTSYDVVMQAVHNGSVPAVREARAGSKPSVFIPESYVEVWRTRGSSPRRDLASTATLEEHYRIARELNA